MFTPITFLAVCICIPALVSTINTGLAQRGFAYKFPDGYSVVRTQGVVELDCAYIYGALVVAMQTLAYEDARGLSDPLSFPFNTVTLNITGAETSPQFYRQFASYLLYDTLAGLAAKPNITTLSANYTLQNAAGSIACKVIIGPPSPEWQQLINGFSGTGLGPRNEDRNRASLSMLEPRQATRNDSAPLEKLTPLVAKDWWGPATTPEDFIMAIATMIVKIGDLDVKTLDTWINGQSVEDEGYHLNVTNGLTPEPFSYLTNRGVLNMLGDAYGAVAKQLGYFDEIRNFESYTLWTNGTTAEHFHVLRFVGMGSM